MNNYSELSLCTLFKKQVENQNTMLKSGLYDAFKNNGTSYLPCDDPKLMSYHVQQLMSEIGEILESDKRWKNFRNTKYDRNNKLEEIADCFIVLLNIAIFSGFTEKELQNAIYDKIEKIKERLSEV